MRLFVDKISGTPINITKTFVHLLWRRILTRKFQNSAQKSLKQIMGLGKSNISFELLELHRRRN